MCEILPARAGVIPILHSGTIFHIYFTRTSGGDPPTQPTTPSSESILPARAGVIPVDIDKESSYVNFTRTSGGDPCA